jgi:hypothetical protein
MALSTSSLAQTQRTAWQPLVTGAVADRVLAAVEQIAAALAGDPLACDIGGMSDGAAGRALFFGYLAEARISGEHAERAERYLDRAIELMGSQSMGWDLFHGITGVAWVAEHLWGRFCAPGDADANEAVDAALYQYLHLSPWPGPFDLVGGLLGQGVYALERLPRASGAACLERIVDVLATEGEHVANGVRWLTKPHLLWPPMRAQHPNGYYDLGVAHGVPSVIAVLAAARASGIATARARALYDGAVAWMRSQRLGPASPSAFPNWIEPGKSEPPPARAAWCYGDPGAATTLYAAARLVDDAALAEEALAIARRAAEGSPAQADVWDAGLCHGSAGLAHLYNRLWQASGEEVFAAAARRWLGAALDMQTPGVGIAGYRSWQSNFTDAPPAWVNDATLLTGALGIGLALLATISTVEPAWDRALLCSLPRVQSM